MAKKSEHQEEKDLSSSGTGQSDLEKAVQEKTQNLQRTFSVISNITGELLTGGYNALTTGYGLLKSAKDAYTNSSAYKYQIIGQNFEGKSIPGDISLPIPKGYSEPFQAEQLFQEVCYSNTCFKGASLGQVFIAENIQFLNCQFDQYTNFIGLAYHHKLGDDVIRGRITNARNENGNVGGDLAVLTVHDANRRLTEEFIKDGNVDAQRCGEKLSFIYGLITIVTILCGKKPALDAPDMDMSLLGNVQFTLSEQQAILEFKALANKISQHYPKALAGAFPFNEHGHVGYLDTPGYYEQKPKAPEKVPDSTVVPVQISPSQSNPVIVPQTSIDEKTKEKDKKEAESPSVARRIIAEKEEKGSSSSIAQQIIADEKRTDSSSKEEKSGSDKSVKGSNSRAALKEDRSKHNDQTRKERKDKDPDTSSQSK